ncbi:hypothetical protein L9F63_015298, partial [Diploptera punctata]
YHENKMIMHVPRRNLAFLFLSLNRHILWFLLFNKHDIFIFWSVMSIQCPLHSTISSSFHSLLSDLQSPMT